jgi:hypothetical protein
MLKAANKVVVPLRVVVRHRATAALLERKARLSAVQGLNLALLITAQDQRVFRGIEVQAHDVQQLVHELRIATELERLDQMGLEVMSPPHAMDQVGTNPQVPRQRPNAPVRRMGRCLMKRGLDDPFGPAALFRWLTTAAWRILLDAGQTALGEALTPAAHRGWLRAKRFSDLLVLLALGRHKDHPGPLHQSHRRASSPSPPLESRTLFVRDRDLRSYTHCVHPFLLQRKTQYKSDNYIHLSNTTLVFQHSSRWVVPTVTRYRDRL